MFKKMRAVLLKRCGRNLIEVRLNILQTPLELQLTQINQAKPCKLLQNLLPLLREKFIRWVTFEDLKIHISITKSNKKQLD